MLLGVIFKKCANKKHTPPGRASKERGYEQKLNKARGGFAKDAPLRKATIRLLARQEVHENGPQIKLGLLRPAGNFSSFGAKPRRSAIIVFYKEPELRTSLQRLIGSFHCSLPCLVGSLRCV